MGEHEPTQIPGGGEYPGGWSHIEIKNAFGGLDTTNSSTAAGKYTDAATLFDQGIETFARSVTNSISEAWEGTAADAAKDAIKRYTDDARQLPNLLSDLSNQINEAAKAIVDTRNAIPNYADHSWTTWINPFRAAEEERSKNEVEQKARDAMHDNYVTRFATFDAQVPVLPQGVNPTAPLDVPSIGPGNPSPGPGPGDSTSPDDTVAAPDTGDPADEDGDDAPDDQTTQSQSTGDTQTQPSSTAQPSAPGAPSSATSPQTTASSTTSGAPHVPGLPGSPQTSAPAPGRSLPGAPGGPSAGNSAAAAAAGRSMGGTPGMMGSGLGGGKGGKGDDESEHKIPDYLINQDNTEELLGETPRTLPGGVIGDDAPGADRPPPD